MNIGVYNCQFTFIRFLNNLGYYGDFFLFISSSKDTDLEIRIVFSKAQIMFLSSEGVEGGGGVFLFFLVSTCFDFESAINCNFCSFWVSFIYYW